MKIKVHQSYLEVLIRFQHPLTLASQIFVSENNQILLDFSQESIDVYLMPSQNMKSESIAYY
jgi:hypothetical protein